MEIAGLCHQNASFSERIKELEGSMVVYCVMCQLINGTKLLAEKKDMLRSKFLMQSEIEQLKGTNGHYCD